MADGDTDDVLLLERLYDRHMEMCVLRQRLDLLLMVPDFSKLGVCGLGGRGEVREPRIRPRDADPSSALSDGKLDRDNMASSCRELLEARLAPLYSSRQQAAKVLNQALPPTSVASSPDACTKALRSLLSPARERPHLPPPPSAAPRLQTIPSARSAGGGAGTDIRGSLDGGGGMTYRSFLERLNRADSKGFVSAIRLFLYSIFGTSEGGPASEKARGGNWAMGREEDDVEVYGSSFLVERCAEFFLAMQSAMGVHPAWAALGYDSIVACREHLERFVMTKIHPLAFGAKLDGAADAAISSHLRALQFLTPDDLGVGHCARNETVLALAREELRKMGSARCPGDMVSRVVRCCDVVFALLDQGRRSMQRADGEPGPVWRPDLDPAGTADDFLPVLIYVVLRANVPRLHSMCDYVQAFHSPVALMSRPGYCFVALRSAVEFLMAMDAEAYQLHSRRGSEANAKHAGASAH